MFQAIFHRSYRSGPFSARTRVFTRRLLCSAGLACVLTSGRSAYAAGQDPLSQIQLEYAAPPTCGSPQEVISKLRAALGSSSEPVAPLSARIVVLRAAQRVSLEYHARKGEVVSQRSLVLDSCAAATEASALLLLLTLDPVLAASLGADQAVLHLDATHPAAAGETNQNPSTPSSGADTGATLSALPSSSSPAASGTTVPSTTAPSSMAPSTTVPSSMAPSTTAQEPTRATEPTRAEPVLDALATRQAPQRPEDPTRGVNTMLHTGWLALGPGLVGGVGPGLALGAELHAGLRLGFVRLTAQTAFARTSWRELSEPGGAQLRADLLRAHLGAALEFGSPVFRFGPRAALGWDWIGAEIEGITTPRPGSTALVSGSAGGWAELMISDSWGFSAQVGAVLPLEQPRFYVAGLRDPVHQPDAVGFESFVGVLWAWGSQNAR